MTHTKKNIRIKFVDFQPNYDYRKNFIYKWLVSHDYDVCVTEHPDYLVFSVFGDDNLQYNDCVKLFYTGECQTPDFNLCDYAIGFDYLDFGDRYLRYPLYFLYEDAYAKMINRYTLSSENGGEIAGEKKGFCAFVCSNHRGSEQRIAFFEKLNAQRHVDSGGKLLNNVGNPVKDKLEFQAAHRFSMAFENTSCPGYTTEKIVESFASGTIPVYYGDPCIVREFNPKAFVNCADYATFDDVIARVLEIDDTPDLYRKYLQEPPLNDMRLKEKADGRLDAFLTNIFQQDKTEAKRFNRNYWGKRLLQERLRQQKAYRRSWYYRFSQFYVRHVYAVSRKNPLLWKLTKCLMRITT